MRQCDQYGTNTVLGSGLAIIHFTSLLRDDSKIKYSISFVDEIHHHLDDVPLFLRVCIPHKIEERNLKLRPWRRFPGKHPLPHR